MLIRPVRHLPARPMPHRPRFGNLPADPERLTRFFLNMGPDAPFKQDAPWAVEMDRITRNTAPFLPLFPSSRDLIGDLASRYNQIRAQKFGRPRPYWDAVPIRKSDFLTDYRQRAYQLVEAGLAQLPGHPDQLPVEWREPKDIGMFSFHRLYTHQAELNGKPVPLVSIVRHIHHRMPKGGPFRCEDQDLWWGVEAPSKALMQDFYQHADKLLAELKPYKTAPRTQENLEQVFARVAELHWFMVQLMPYCRGSAGIADLTAKVITDYLGIHTGRWGGGKAPDLEAFVTPLDGFRKGYMGLFEAPPRWE